MLGFSPMSKRTKAILIQAVIVAGVVACFRVALPRIEKARMAARIAGREQAIHAFLQSVTAQVGISDAQEGGAGKAGSALRLRITPDVAEVQRRLGAPDQSMTDFAGAQHLTWFGKGQKLLASFNRGQLYALTISDLAGEHGERVFQTSAQYQKF
jgi:hypothetical protein